MDRLTDAARAALDVLELDAARQRCVLEHAARMACAEILPVHIELGVVIDEVRREAGVTSAA